ncbi:HAD-IA family hydrolase [Alteromonas facilis]|uniref:HAD-IA family hydrolase n=1 Tax=Alteromonas facilis TaxID=2048004 RepID=UPI0013DCE883|nr:HAD-IA family hydrolase [Alteromonas facilis]
MIFYRPMSPISALSFDLDDTLYDNGPIIREATHSLNQFLTRQYPTVAALLPTHWAKHRKAALLNDPRLASDMSRLRHCVLRALASDAGLSETQQKAVADEGLEHFYHVRSNFSINENIYSLLKELKNHCPIVAITNGNVNVQQVGIADLFSEVFQANIHAPMKPHHAMFESALAHLQLPPQQLLHVGDNLIKDVWGAHRLGIQTAWFACNRQMDLSSERTHVLPTLQLDCLQELTQLF